MVKAPPEKGPESSLQPVKTLPWELNTVLGFAFVGMVWITSYKVCSRTL